VPSRDARKCSSGIGAEIGGFVTAVGGTELACQQSMAPRGLEVEDATGRTVRPRFGIAVE